MPRIEQYQCDAPGCTVTKGASNHWYKIGIGEALHLYPWDFFLEGATDDTVPTMYICGPACVNKVVQQFMEEQYKIPKI